MKTIFKYIKPKSGRIALGLTIKFIGTILELLIPKLLSDILNLYVPAKDMPKIFLFGGAMLLCAVICLVGNVVANRMSTATSRDITEHIRNDLFSKITSLTCKDTDRFTIPSLISRVTSDTYNLHNMIDRMQRIGVRAPILLLGGIAVTFTLDKVLTLVLAATMPFLLVVIIFVSSNGIKQYTRSQEKLDGLIKRAQESMQGIRVIKALSKTDYECERYGIANSEVNKAERKAGVLMSITNPIMNLFVNLGLTAVIVVGAYRVNSGAVLPGTMVAFLSYFTIILNALMMVSRMFMMCTKGIASGRRVAEILDCVSVMELVESEQLNTDNFIEFENVSFSYDKVRNNLENISFGLKKGETLGIIGPTGSGKSTILALLMRFYDTDRGTVRIDGKDVRSIKPQELYKMFGVAMQNDFLIAASIKDNIGFERDIKDENIKSAAAVAQAEFISDRAGGFEGEIAAKGADISGGQKQRLLLARALAGNSPILIFDDSSSALDYKTDAAFRKALAATQKDATKIIVAQRVSAIQNADKIMVLDDGKILGMGTHSYLLENCESYKEIALAQMGDVE